MVEPMRIVAILSGMLVQRITRNTHRIANSDGIIVINVAEGLRNTSRNARKMTLPVSTKLSARVGRRRCVICVARTPWPATLPRTERSADCAARAAARAAQSALRSVRGRVAGQGVLATQITQRLLPTLAESFVLTGSVIFLAFLLVFR